MIPLTDIKINNLKYGLYVVSTPIGNLGDITLRAIEVLRLSDYILCEDTRTSKNLMLKYNIQSKLISNHKFNEKKNVSNIIKILKSNFPKNFSLRGIKIAIDCANGAGYKSGPKLLKTLGANVYDIGTSPDGARNPRINECINGC